MLKKLLAMLLAVSMLLVGFAFAEEAEVEHTPVVILYANDIHCGIEDNVGYAGVAAYEKAYHALINYIMDELGGVVGEEYADPYGQGRIVIYE